MTVRTSQEVVTFTRPFTMSGAEGSQPAGRYTIMTEEEVIESLSFLAYRRTSTVMLIPLQPGSRNSVQSILIDPRELEMSLANDRALLPQACCPA